MRALILVYLSYLSGFILVMRVLMPDKCPDNFENSSVRPLVVRLVVISGPLKGRLQHDALRLRVTLDPIRLTLLRFARWHAT